MNMNVYNNKIFKCINKNYENYWLKMIKNSSLLIFWWKQTEISYKIINSNSTA